MDVELRQKTGTTSARCSLGWATALLSMLLWLVGCGAPPSVTSLRRHAACVYSFEVPAACETVYQRIARRAQERYRHTNLATYQPGVTATLAPDGQAATVTFFNAGGLGLRYVLTADLHALDPARTEVQIYAASRTSAPEVILWQHWANIPLDNSPAQPSPPPEENGPKDANDLKAGGGR
jgi:hypothetical protein